MPVAGVSPDVPRARGEAAGADGAVRAGESVRLRAAPTFGGAIPSFASGVGVGLFSLGVAAEGGADRGGDEGRLEEIHRHEYGGSTGGGACTGWGRDGFHDR